jgi:small Trp-rich protein
LARQPPGAGGTSWCVRQAAVWWAWADASGYTKRKAMEKMDQRKQERINRQKEAMQPGKRR